MRSAQYDLDLRMSGLNSIGIASHLIAVSRAEFLRSLMTVHVARWNPLASAARRRRIVIWAAKVPCERAPPGLVRLD